jgi:tetratricopeptide (TPR) repeat protein
LLIAVTALGILFAAFLVVFNLPNSPLEPVREWPYIGRLGRVFETQRGTGRVRVLIWGGAVQMITADPVRTLIGYGPETMHVAFNPYYPPDLAHYEARNASPDRSHNETFDALVITGVVGFLAYLFLFVSLFYHGLRWLGLVTGKRDRNRLLLFMGAGGLLSVLGFQIVDSTGRFFGVALPAGMMVGLFLYLLWTVLLGRVQPQQHPFRSLLIGLLAAIIGHFIEIHFGIAIAATRTLFWVYAALLVVAGYLVAQRPALLEQAAVNLAPAQSHGGARSRSRRSSRSRTRASRPRAPESVGIPSRPVLGLTGVVSLILLTLAYDYVTNPARESNPLSILWHTLTARWESNQWLTSPGILWLLTLTWGLGVLLSVARIAGQGYRPDGSLEPGSGELRGGVPRDAEWWLGNLLFCGGISLAVFFGMALILAARLVPPPEGTTLDVATAHLANHITVYYVALFTLLLLLAGALTWRSPQPRRWWDGRWPVLLSPALAVAVLVFLVNTNLNEVRADILYKQAWLGYHRPSLYDAAIATYRRTLDLKPEQDYYYLFLGKAYLEKAQAVSNPEERERLLQQTQQALERARALNPLNPDHTANLARLYQTWGRLESDPERRKALLEKALTYHRQATELAPNAAHLYNEWAITLNLLGRYDQALEKLERSRRLDAEFADTFVLLGEVYAQQGELESAIEAYQRAAALDPKRADAYRGLAQIYAHQERFDEAIAAYQQVLALAPRDSRAYQNLALLYEEQGRLDEALEAALRAAELAPGEPTVHLILGDVYRLRGELDAAIRAYQQALVADPQAVQAYTGLALAYQAQGNLDAALEQAQAALALRPDNRSLQALVEQIRNSRP